MGFIKRVATVAGRVFWLAKLQRSFVTSFLYVARSLRDRALTGDAYFADFHFTFRKMDLTALYEVLIQDEYGFLAPVVKNRPGALVLDIGSHIGLFALRMFSLNPGLKLLSVEASPATFALLQKNRDRNPELHANWNILHRAAWKDESGICFSECGDSMSHRASADGKCCVPGIPLRALIEQLPADQPITLLKVDIEGAEESFLCEAPELLSRVECLVIELHPYLCDCERVQEALKIYFPYIKDISGRQSKKPLLLCSKTPV